MLRLEHNADEFVDLKLFVIELLRPQKGLIFAELASTILEEKLKLRRSQFLLPVGVAIRILSSHKVFDEFAQPSFAKLDTHFLLI